MGIKGEGGLLKARLRASLLGVLKASAVPRQLEASPRAQAAHKHE